MGKQSEKTLEKDLSKKDLAKRKPWYREYAEALIVAAILALFIRTFIVQAFKIPSGSMKNTLLVGDHLLVNKFIYGTEIPFTHTRILAIRPPERGDVIVFEFPGDMKKPYFDRRDFIKRVIGVPGDTVAVRDKKVYINGKLYVTPEAIHKDPNVIPPGYGPRDFMPPVKVPPGEYFVMGDNRDRSYDSRYWGFVKRSEILGKAFIRYWSWNAKTDRPRWGRIGMVIH